MGRPKATAPAIKPAKSAISIDEFCDSYGISRRTFDYWDARGAAPETTQPVPGGRRFITREAEEEWKLAHRARAARDL